MVYHPNHIAPPHNIIQEVPHSLVFGCVQVFFTYYTVIVNILGCHLSIIMPRLGDAPEEEDDDVENDRERRQPQQQPLNNHHHHLSPALPQRQDSSSYRQEALRRHQHAALAYPGLSSRSRSMVLVLLLVVTFWIVPNFFRVRTCFCLLDKNQDHNDASKRVLFVFSYL